MTNDDLNIRHLKKVGGGGGVGEESIDPPAYP